LRVRILALVGLMLVVLAISPALALGYECWIGTEGDVLYTVLGKCENVFDDNYATYWGARFVGDGKGILNVEFPSEGGKYLIKITANHLRHGELIITTGFGTPICSKPITNSTVVEVVLPKGTVKVQLISEGVTIWEARINEIQKITEPIPGLEAVFAVAGLIATAYLLRRRA